jgi:DNA polymerase-1
MNSDIIYLIDGTSLCYRSYYAIQLSNSQGFPTGAIYGFFNTLRKIIKKYNIAYLGVCFDVSRKTFRQKKFKEYKIQRPPVPDNLKLQLPRIKELIDHFGITLIEREGFEADDLLASLTKKAQRDQRKVMIISSDKDIYQLLDNKTVSIYDPVKDLVYNEREFKGKYGFAPCNMVDYLALVGDPTDNVPGAKGIGKVGAAELIKRFGSLENIFNHLAELSPALRKNLIQNKKQIKLSKELVTLAEPELNYSWEELKIREARYPKIYKTFRELEFTSLLKEIPSPSLDYEIEVIEGIPRQFTKQIERAGEVVLYVQDNDVYICGTQQDQVYTLKVEEAKDILGNEKIKKISYDVKHIYSLLNNIYPVKGAWFDVKIAGYLINPALPNFTIESLVGHFLSCFVQEVPLRCRGRFILQLYKKLQEEIVKKKLESLFFNVEMPLVKVLSDIETWGIKIDKTFLASFSHKVDDQIQRIKEDIFKIAGKEFNLNSPRQLSTVLFQDLGIPPLKRTKTGFSTNEEVLDKLSQKYPIARFLLQYRELTKLHFTYIIPFLKELGDQHDRIHAQFNQTGTQTGRLSSLSPNLQNIPVKSDFARSIRKSFIPSFDEGVILSCDYSQIELRVLAHLSGDESLIEAFTQGYDIHAHTASLIFDVSIKEVTSTRREVAKRVNFGIIYGMSAYGLAKELKISVEEATSFIENYFLRYPKVKKFIEKMHVEVAKQGYVSTILGRLRYLEGIHNASYDVNEFARRQAVNTPIQGSAADIIKLAMINIYQTLKENNMRSRMIMQIHDELVFDVSPQERESIQKIAKEKMENVISLRVPLTINLKAGKNWCDLAPVVC